MIRQENNHLLVLVLTAAYTAAISVMWLWSMSQLTTV